MSKHSENSLSVLVLDACQRSALAVTRSLGQAGIKVLTADEPGEALAGGSRYSVSYHRYPSPSSDGHRFIDAIVELCERHDIGIVMPMTEMTTALLLDARQRLKDTLLPFAESDVIEQLADKSRLMQLAQSIGVPIPDTVYCQASDSPDALDSLPYPLVIKPGKSWLATDDGWIHSTVRIADDTTKAHDILRQDIALHRHSYMLQQHVPGHGCGVFAIYDHGKPLAFFAHRRIHEKPPRGGISVISESAAIDEKLLEYSRKLLDAVQWHGVAMVEFRADDAGNAWLMEINTRFWGSLQLAIDAGVDFPMMLYRITDGQDVTTQHQYREGCRLRWLLGDLDWLYLMLKDSDNTVLSKLRAIMYFCFWAPFTTRTEINRAGDLGPFWVELKEYWRHVRGRF